ncbi:MAG: hypothetical protein J7F05_16715 [Trichodesmium erythraeum GBRTRLIN201]|nr:hypothetical protein [Trichodesmium erythraeum GBRTRLIN201]
MLIVSVIWERSYKATSLQSCSLFEEKLTDLLLIVMPLSNAWAQNLIYLWSLRARVSTDFGVITLAPACVQ